MERLNSKKKIFIALIFIFCLIFFNHFLSIFHELGHQQTLRKYGIESEITLNFPKFKERFLMGTIHFSKESCEKINSLPLNKKTEILLSGIKADIKVSVVLIFLGALCFVVSICFYSKKKSKGFYILFFIGIFLILLVMARILIIHSNLLYKPGTDVFWISNNVSC